MADKEFTPVPSGRKVHYTRIFGTNKKEEILTEMWVDMERFDKWSTTTQRHGQWQEVDYKFRWFDKPDDPDPPKSRKTKIVKVIDRELYPRPTDPDQPDDPDEWIPIDVVTRFEARRGDEVIEYRLVSEKARDDQRTIKWRRIVHYDTNVDDKAEKAAAADPTLKKYYIEAKEYERDGSTQDKGQWAETEVVLKHRDLASGLTGYQAVQTGELIPAPSVSAGADQEVEHKFNSQYLLDNAEASELPDHPADTQHVIDPFQNIVNIQLSSPEVAVLGIGTLPNAEDTSNTETSEDGLEWEAEFDAGSSNAATGLGKTVVCKKNMWVAFGKPRDGDSCFITAKGDTIQRGVLDEHGELTWSTVATLPDYNEDHFVGAQTCSFAGGAFFVSYLRDADNDDVSYLAVSFTGETFQLDIKPFNGVVAAANGTGTDPGDNHPEPVGANVAYDKENKRYVTTGYYHRSYWNQENIGAGETHPVRFLDQNFMSSVSSNGTSWSATFDTSECSGYPPTASTGIGPANEGRTSVTFGNGLFVAATAHKLNYDYFTAPSYVVYKLTAYASAVATSTNGSTWTNTRLPGSQSSGWVYADANAASGGYGTCARFFKAKKNESGVPGFFVVTGLEYGGGPGFSGTKLWQSETGSSWTLVRTDAGKYGFILSAVKKSRGKIVYRE